jgi:hypothetical protein
MSFALPEVEGKIAIAKLDQMLGTQSADGEVVGEHAGKQARFGQADGWYLVRFEKFFKKRIRLIKGTHDPVPGTIREMSAAIHRRIQAPARLHRILSHAPMQGGRIVMMRVHQDAGALRHRSRNESSIDPIIFHKPLSSK